MIEEIKLHDNIIQEGGKKIREEISVTTDWEKPIKFFDFTIEMDVSGMYAIYDKDGFYIGYIEDHLGKMDKLTIDCKECGNDLMTRFYEDTILNCDQKDVTNLLQIPYGYQCWECLEFRIHRINRKLRKEVNDE